MVWVKRTTLNWDAVTGAANVALAKPPVVRSYVVSDPVIWRKVPSLRYSSLASPNEYHVCPCTRHCVKVYAAPMSMVKVHGPPP